MKHPLCLLGSHVFTAKGETCRAWDGNWACLRCGRKAFLLNGRVLQWKS